MKKHEKCKRILAFLLVALMILQQSSVITLADEMPVDTQETQNQEEAAEARTSEESKSETPVSDTSNTEIQSETTPEPAPAEPTAAEETTLAAEPTEAPAEVAPTTAPAEETAAVVPETTEIQEQQAIAETAIVPETEAAESSAEPVAKPESDGEPIAEIQKVPAEKEDDFTKFLTSMKIFVDDKEITDETNVKPDSRFKFDIKFAENRNLPRMAQTVKFRMPDNLMNWNCTGQLKERVNGQEVVAANYTIDTDGNVVITFTDDFYAKANDGYLKGDFFFESSIERKDNEEEITIIIPGTNLEKKIKFNTNASLNAEKTASYDPVSGEITYTVKVKANEGTVTDVKIEDILGENLELIKTDGKDYILTVGDTTISGDFANGEATIGTLNANQEAVLVYKAKLKNLPENIASIDTDKTNNSVTATGKNGNKDVISNTPHINVGDWFKNYTWGEKSDEGTTTENGKLYVKWKAEYNNSKLVSVNGNTVTDTLNSDLLSFEQDTKVTVKRSDGITFTFNIPAGKTWSYEIGSNPADTYQTGKEAYSYTFEYNSLVDSDSISDMNGKQNVQNAFSDDKGHSWAHNSDVTGGIQDAEKQCVGITAEKATWQVVIHVPAAGWQEYWFTDSTQQVSENGKDWERWAEIDPKSIQVSSTGPNVGYYREVTYEENGKKPVSTFYFGTAVGEGKDNKTLSSLPKYDKAYDVTITYDTFNKYYKDSSRNEQIDMDLDAVVKNYIKIKGQIEKAAEDKIPGKLNVEKQTTDHYIDANGKYHPYGDEDAGQLLYIVKIDTSRSGLGNGNVTIEDIHSAGMNYVPGTAAVMRSKVNYAVYGTDTTADEKEWVSGAVSEPVINDNTMTFTLQNLTGTATDDKPFVYYLYYRMQLDKNYVTSSEGENLTNTAIVRTEDGKEVTTNTPSYNYKNPLLNKKENQYPASSNGYKAGFEITVPSKYPYIKDGQLTVMDEYSENLILDNSSLKVTDSNDRELAAGSEYTVTPAENNKGIQVVIKDAVEGVTYKITYQAFVSGTLGVSIDYTNKAYIPGYETKQYQTSSCVTKTQQTGGTVGAETYSFRIFKYGDNDLNAGLEGAEFTLKQGDTILKEGITTDVTGNSPVIVSSMLANGTILEPYIKYTLIETKAPNGGYQLNSEPIDFYFTDDTKSEEEIKALGLEGVMGIYSGAAINVQNKKIDKITVSGEKTWDYGTQPENERPESIIVQLLRNEEVLEEKEVTKGTDGKWMYEFTDLDPADENGAAYVYAVREKEVPKDYEATVTGYNIKNTYTPIEVSISKKALGGEKELPGAKLQLLKGKDAVEKWESTGETKVIKGLEAGTEYTLHEVAAPAGYTLAADIKFMVDADGTVKINGEAVKDNHIVMKDAMTSVSVKKTDIVDGKELAGAKMQILDKDKKVVTTIKGEKLEWTSTKEAKVIEGLVAGETYYLHEEAAPTGYTVANDTKFVLKTDGTVDAAQTTTTVKDGVLLVQDSMVKSEKASVEVTKTLSYEGSELGAVDQTFYVALYGDEACTNRLSDVKAIVFKNASSSTVKFTDLEIGRKYYVSECDANGTAQSAGVLADQTAYIANFQNGNTVTVDNADGSKEVYFQNEFLKIPDGFYKVGKLTVTKKLLGTDGNAKNSNDTFYAGIFDDAEFTKLSENVSQNIVALALNGSTSASATVDVSVVEGKTTTLYVTEVDADGNPVADAESFKYDVTVDNEKVSFTDTDAKKSVTITNKEQSEETKTVTNKTTNNTTTGTNSQSSAAKSVKTGDNTPIAVFVLLLAVAAAVIAFIFIRRRKNNK